MRIKIVWNWATQRLKKKRITERLRALNRRRKWLFPSLAAVFVLLVFGFVYLYTQISDEIDARLSGQVFQRASVVFSAPTPLTVGERISAGDAAARLRRALYSEGESGGSRVGTYTLDGERLEIHPGPLSYFAREPIIEGAATVQFRNGRVAAIYSPGATTPPQQYWLEPEPITTLFDQSRVKRRVIKYQDMPPMLVSAVLAAEDRRFFSHHGVNVYRILEAAWRDLQADEPLQGGSTLTMQLARNFFLTPERTVRRKIEEIFLALFLEQKLSKEQILELYANEVYLGQRGSFSIDGFGEAAQAYFNKDVRSLTLPEDALLAALIRGPNLYSPYRHPAQALRIRNYVLHEMQEDGFAAAAQVREAEAAPLAVAPQNVEGSQAPYFVDMVKDQLLEKFPERDLLSEKYRIYTTLDPGLQRAASESVRSGMQEVDQTLSRRHRAKSMATDPNEPQVALVALDPHTGEVRALVGGRNYAVSQLNHALASRQPGSSFKPFVYAAALSSAVTGAQPMVTPATILMDEPTTFAFNGNVYEPRNYEEEYHGPVTLREALAYSLNCATVSLAQMIGYENVRELAVAAGINNDILATPALALGAYDATPLEIAGAYTIFSNAGKYEAPSLVSAVRDDAGRELWQPNPIERQVLDPRVAYQMVSLMESVVDHGTGAGVRARGFVLPAAGKTGTSHDGWFAGFTSNLLAVVWVGYDDDHQLGLSGGSSALPVWADFMKDATSLPDHRDATQFAQPPGLVTAEIQLPVSPGDPVPLAASPQELFVEGTEPRGSLAVLGTAKKLFGRLLGFTHAEAPAGPPPSPPKPSSYGVIIPDPAVRPTNLPASVTAPLANGNKRPNAIRRFISIFRHKPGPEDSNAHQNPEAPKQQDNSPPQE
jgi:penicillin-binding protein 1B